MSPHLQHSQLEIVLGITSSFFCTLHKPSLHQCHNYVKIQSCGVNAFSFYRIAFSIVSPDTLVLKHAIPKISVASKTEEHICLKGLDNFTRWVESTFLAASPNYARPWDQRTRRLLFMDCERSFSAGKGA